MFRDRVSIAKAQVLSSLAPPPRTRASRVRYVCEATGCGRTTNERKPFCIDHVDRLPYVRAVQSQLAAFDADLKSALLSRPEVSLESPWVREILFQVAQGAKTLARLSIVVELSEEALEKFVRAIDEAGLIKFDQVGSRRGTVRKIVHITDAGRRKVEIEMAKLEPQPKNVSKKC